MIYFKTKSCKNSDDQGLLKKLSALDTPTTPRFLTSLNPLDKTLYKKGGCTNGGQITTRMKLKSRQRIKRYDPVTTFSPNLDIFFKWRAIIDLNFFQLC